jgi:lipopolysaccharide export LptBFGC system permease protein LptF
MVTLHAYVLRELLKTFALTLVALTALFTMGGGLYNVMRYEGVGAGDILGFIPLLIPIVVTLTMPVAALFAGSMVYGRLAADNELLACRAAGVNVHRLFLPAILLSICVVAFTLLFSDLVIPDFIRRMDRYARTNLRDLAYQKMQVSGHILRDQGGERFLLTASGVRIPSENALREQNLPIGPGLNYLLVDSPVFLQIDASHTLERYITARQGLCKFDTRSTPIEVTTYVDDASDFDLGRRTVRLKQQQFRFQPPLEFPRKASMVDLATLLRWRRQPWEVDRLRSRVRDFLQALTAERLFSLCTEQLTAPGALTLADERGRAYKITAAECAEDRKGLALTDVHVESADGDSVRPWLYEAPRALLTARPGPDGRLRVELHFSETSHRSVIEHNPRASDYEQGRGKAGFVLTDNLMLPQPVSDEMQNYTEATVCDPSVSLPVSPALDEKRVALQKEGTLQRRKMTADIHFRLGFNSSTLVTVIMAAALGAVFRGSRALAAFALACIPFASVALLMVMARQMAEKPGTESLGPLLTWGGMAGIALLDLAILRLGVRR